MRKIILHRALFIVLLFLIPISAFATPPWNLDFEGRLLYRVENKKNASDSFIRHRHRMRVQAGVTGKWSSKTKFGLGLTTGDSPGSRNETLDGSFVPKSFMLDVAFAEYEFSEKLEVIMGKMPNPFKSAGGSELIWDGDLSPEGVATKLDAWANWVLGTYWVEERKFSRDTFALSASMNKSIEFRSSELELYTAFVGFSHTRGFEVFEGGAAGNSTTTNVDQENVYLNGYNIFNLGAEWNSRLWGLHSSCAVDLVKNLAAERRSWGLLLLWSVGKLEEAWDTSFEYSYTWLQADAVVGALASSGLYGGETGVYSHDFSVSTLLSSAVELKASYAMADKLSTSVEGYASNTLNRMRVDLKVEF